VTGKELQVALIRNRASSGAMPDLSQAPHYWSYKALLEDKKRCLTDIPHVQHVTVNSLRREGQDHKVSQRAMSELKQHNQVHVDNKQFYGVMTPPHAFLNDENRPHYSQKSMHEEKTRMRTAIRAKQSTTMPRSASARNTRDRGDTTQAGKIFVEEGGKFPRPQLEAPTMTELMQPGPRMQGRPDYEAVLNERRDSTDPHQSHQVLTMKKKAHFTKIHQKPMFPRAQSARTYGSQGSGKESEGGFDPSTWSRNVLAEERRESDPHQSQRALALKKNHLQTTLHKREGSEIHPVKYELIRDPSSKSYHGECNEAWPEGREDPTQVGRYLSQAYLAIDKRRHAANVDGTTNVDRARSREDKQRTREGGSADSEGFYKPDFCARGEKYHSQFALAQHKKRHLTNLYSDAGGEDMAPRSYSHGAIQQELFTSHKNMAYGKRGHVVGMTSTRDIERLNNPPDDGASNATSDCDVGKGISRMMKGHRDDAVHISQTEFFLKKKNHATAVHVKPRPPPSREGSVYSSESGGGDAILQEKRRPSNPHHSSKAFALKKKYHQTAVHEKADSRMHTDMLKHKSLDKEPATLQSHKQLKEMKKIHAFDYNPATRTKPESRPVPQAPVPRNGQWTPQHVCD